MRSADHLLPRDQQGARSQQLLIVLLGDYWHLRPEPIPSAALVTLLELFDVTPAGARAAVQRLAKRGFLVTTRTGRTTSYAVSPMSQESVDAHVQLLFRSHIAQPWDGTWSVVGYSLREDQRSTRNALRERLRQSGFGNVHDGLWIRPGDHRRDVDSIVRELSTPPEAGQLTVFVGARLPDGQDSGVSRAAFGLDERDAAYRDFVRRWEPVAAGLETAEQAAARGDAGPPAHRDADVLRVRTSVMRDWRELRHADPMLPRALTGDDAPFERALAVCSAIYDATGPAAEAAFRRILRPHSAELADLASHHTFRAYAEAPAGERA
ncbi:PaaX family transcriptional regulator [Microbacterium timonense]|uniref:PaaX family transcriptional regulator n=1 Tax=Microbacterium timonense TaxID=2086576 RepID=UPI000D10E1A2|nr:PaaX family transcriptional regulator C-terminal domain-containing protein [Microbacterium timonense]